VDALERGDLLFHRGWLDGFALRGIPGIGPVDDPTPEAPPAPKPKVTAALTPAKLVVLVRKQARDSGGTVAPYTNPKRQNRELTATGAATSSLARTAE
jgi:hypothetical protein